MKEMKIVNSFSPIITICFLSLFLSNCSIADQIIPGKILADNGSGETLTLLRAGEGKNNVIQGIALDPKNNWIYTLNDVGSPEKGVINRFKYQNTGTINAEEFQLPSSKIGHQGISIDPRNGRMFSSAGKDINNSGWYFVSFNFSSNTQPSDVVVTKVFGEGFSKKTNSMPIFTPDGNYLIARSSSKRVNVVRVFETKNLNLDSEDISDKYLYEWYISPELTPKNFSFQAMATDGKRVYFLSGGENSLPKRLYIYDLRGNLLQKDDNVNLGLGVSLSIGKEGHWEPEGMSYDRKSKSLLVAFAMGDKKHRTAVIFPIRIH